MAKKFVRNITNAKLQGADKEPLFTNIQNDILSDEKDVYIRNRDEYFPLTQSITDIKSPKNTVKITRDKSTVYIESLGGNTDKDLSNPKTITVKKPIVKTETENNITLSLDPTIANLKAPKAITATSPIIKEETENNITLSLEPTIANLKTPKTITVTSPIIKKETDEEITLSTQPLADQIEVSGGLKKEVTEKGVRLFTEDKEDSIIINTIEPLIKEEEGGVITLSLKDLPKDKDIKVASPLQKLEEDGVIKLSIDPKAFEGSGEQVQEKVINVKSPLIKEEEGGVITLSLKDIPKEKDLGVTSPLKLADGEDRQVIYLDEEFIKKVNKEKPEKRFSYPLVDNDDLVSLDENFKKGLSNANLKASAPLRVETVGDSTTIKIDNLDTIINSAIKDYMSKNPIESKNYKFTYPLSLASDNTVNLDPTWIYNTDKGLLKSVTSLEPITTSFSSNKLTVNTTASFDKEYRQLKEDNATLKTKVDELNKLALSLSKNVFALQKKLGV